MVGTGASHGGGPSTLPLDHVLRVFSISLRRRNLKGEETVQWHLGNSVDRLRSHSALLYISGQTRRGSSIGGRKFGIPIGSEGER